jgi:TonB-dependent starch-binding outer membrane protein SusC
LKNIVVKYSLLFLLLVFSANLFAQNIQLPSNISLKKCFKLIEKQSEYTFFYSDDEISINLKTSQSYDEDLTIILEKLSQSSDFEYHITENRIVLNPRIEKKISIQGIVYDESKTPIPGVNIYSDKSNYGTISDEKGSFVIEIPIHSGIVTFSFIGFQNKQFQFQNDTIIDVFLKENITSLSEVVIVAYGKESKDLLTGSINSLNLNQYVFDGQENLNKSLQAISTGVYVQANAGTPGSSVNVKMRGVGSINAGTSPLYIVDGIPVVSGNYSQIEFSGQLLDALPDFNLFDIENITVLKDAASSSLYGSRASNGVILINTKLGKNGESTILFRTSMGIRNVSNKMDLLNAKQWMTVVNEEYERNGEALVYTQQEINNPTNNTDWLNEVFRNAFFQNYNIAFSGGTETSSYYISGNAKNEDGVIIGTDIENYGLRLNYENKLLDNLILTLRANQISSKINRIEGDQSLNGPLPNALSMPPIFPVYNEEGSYYNDGPYANPLSIANEEKNLAKVFRSLNSLDFNYQFSKSLSIKSILGYDYYRLREESYAPNTTRQGSKYNGYGIEANSDVEYLSNNTFLTFEKGQKFSKYKITTGVNIEKVNEHFSYLRGQDFPGGDIQYLDAAATTITSSSYAEETKLQSVFARINYGFKEKYFVSLNSRLDGSSKFGKDNRYGFFPSLSGMWYLSKENFLKANSAIDFLKLRASVGQIGNDRINNYLHFDLFQLGDNYYGEPGISPYQLQNSQLKWETTLHYNLGIELGLFTNLKLTTDLYYKLTSDLLLEKPMPPSSGYNFILSNIGKVENYGVEVELDYFKRFNEFLWHSKLVFSSYKNQVLELYDDQPIRNIGRARSSIEVGEPISYFYGFNALYVDPQTGDIVYEDIDHNGSINDEDKKFIGSPHPKFYGGYMNSISYKSFNLSVLLNYMYGNEIYNGTQFYRESFSEQDNMLLSVLDRWKEPGDITDIPRFSSSNELLSSRYIEDGSYIKVKQIKIGYNLHDLFRPKIQKLEVFISLENVFTFTKYTGMDPEINYEGSNTIRMGTDFFTCPQPRTFLIGLCARF